MGEMGVNRDSENLAVQIFELLICFIEGYDLGGAHESEVEGVPEE